MNEAMAAVATAGAILAGKPARTEFLPAAELQVDYGYQRHYNPAKVDRMVKEFDPDAMGVLLVSRRADGSYFLMDGGHRKEVAIRRFGPDVLVECKVYEELDWDREAFVFFKVNSERGPVTTFLRYRAAYEGNETEVRQIAGVLDKLGIQYPWWTRGKSDAHPNTIYCWVTLQQIYRREDLSYLTSLLRLIQETWEGEGEAFHGLMVKAMDHLVRCHGDDEAWDEDEFVRKLRPHHPYQLRRAAEIMMSRTPHLRLAEAMHAVYNKAKRVNRLDDFRQRPASGRPREQREAA